MKKLLLSAAALALSATVAAAADLPYRKAPVFVPPPPPLWTGFYVGLNAGYTWSESNSFTLPATDTGLLGFGYGEMLGAIPNTQQISNNGFIGGGQIGYNYQFNDKFLVGLEADIAGIAGSSGNTSYFWPGSATWAPTGINQTSGLDYLGTVRGRVGYLFTPTFLLYATGGLAYGQANLSLTAYGPTWATPMFGAQTFSDTRVGWTVGGGVEWMFMPHWSAKLEYLYYDLGSAQTPAIIYAYGAASNISSIAAQHRFDGNVVRVGVNYHFNWAAPAPVVAKY